MKTTFGGRKLAPEPNASGLQKKLLATGGLLLILLGAYALFRPNLMMPAKRESLQIGGQTVLMETRRVIAVPRPLGTIVIVSGLGLILLAFTKA